MKCRYCPALATLFLPPAVMILVQQVPLLLLPASFVAELKPACYVQSIQPNVDRKACDPAPPAAPAPAATPTPTVAPAPAAAPAPGAAKEGEKSPPKAKTVSQLRAVEAKARAEFGVASAALLAISAGAALFAGYQLYAGWGPGNTFRNRRRVQHDRSYVAGTTALVVLAAVATAWHDWGGTDFSHTLIDQIRNAALGFGSITDTIWFGRLVGANLFAAYVSAGLLLVYLSSLSLDSRGDGGKSGIAGLQIAVIIGAAIFAIGGYANTTGVALATLAVDDGPGAPLLGATKAVLDLWAVANSAFILTAIGTAYYGIRRDAPPAAATQKDSPLALSTPSGDDFKALGWLVQILLALAPIWAPASLSKIFDAAKSIQ
jgi:hypothetical protein